MPARLLRGDIPPFSLDERGRARLSVKFEKDVPVEEARRTVTGAGGAVTGEGRYERFGILDASIDAKRIEALAAADRVKTVDLATLPRKVAGWAANQEMDVIPLWDPPYELSGAGYRLGMWDGGNPQTTHPELIGRVVLEEVVAGGEEHATHTAGVLIAQGVSPSEPLLSRAAAYQGIVHSWDFNDAYNEFADAINMGIQTSNNSWGAFLGWWYDPNPSGVLRPGWRDAGGEELFGAYILETSIIDDLVYQADGFGLPFIVTFPAGDDRDEGPGMYSTGHDGTYYPDYPYTNPYFDCVNPLSTGKNVITVGGTNNISQITDFSCWGPADDGRIKPDLAARGKNVYSCAVGGGYANATGTSASAAVVNSASVLVMEQYARNFGGNPGSAMVKALLVDYAQDRGPAGPDALYGFGVPDILATVQAILWDAGTHDMIKDQEVGDGEVLSWPMEVPPGSPPLRVTLSWIDPAGDPAEPEAIVNDLDLQLLGPSAQPYYPFRLSAADPTLLATAVGPNPVDTVEQIVVNNPPPGVWTVRVSGTNVPIDSPQRFALVSNTAMTHAPEPTGVVFDINPDGSSTDIHWDPVADPELVEFRIFRSDDIENDWRLLATVPAGTFAHTDSSPAPDLVAYDVRAVYNRAGARVMSAKYTALRTPTPTVVLPLQNAVLPNGGTTTRILGRTKLVATVDLFETGNPVPFATVTADGDGLFWIDHDFGGTGPVSIWARSDWFHEGTSLPSLEVEFLITP